MNTLNINVNSIQNVANLPYQTVITANPQGRTARSSDLAVRRLPQVGKGVRWVVGQQGEAGSPRPCHGVNRVRAAVVGGFVGLLLLLLLSVP